MLPSYGKRSARELYLVHWVPVQDAGADLDALIELAPPQPALRQPDWVDARSGLMRRAGRAGRLHAARWRALLREQRVGGVYCAPRGCVVSPVLLRRCQVRLRGMCTGDVSCGASGQGPVALAAACMRRHRQT
jgi:hypothetical protein